jgi:hypothetical protein
LLSRIQNLFFKAPKVLSTVTFREECLRLKISFALVGWFLFPYSVKWYLTPCRGIESHYGMHTQHLLGRIYLQLDIYYESVCQW